MGVNARLFEPLRVRGVEFANRLWVPPMCQYTAVDGLVQPWHLVHYGGFALGRPGLVIAEATGVLPEGRITPQCAGIWDDATARAWRPVADFLAAEGVPFGIQLGHAGRKASTHPLRRGGGASIPVEEGGWETVGPSPVAFESLAAPRELDAADIARVVRAFADAARRAEDAGFSVVEVHGAHGYLIHSFLSPLSNHRTDAYGGSPAGRARFLLEVVRAVRDAVSDAMPLFLRLSATDWVPGGLEVDDIVELVPELEAAGVDVFDISSGGNDPRQQIPLGAGYQVPAARAVKRVATVPVTAVGLLTDPLQFEQVLVDEAADAVFVGRQSLREPMLPQRAAFALRAEQTWPWQYERARYSR